MSSLSVESRRSAFVFVATLQARSMIYYDERFLGVACPRNGTQRLFARYSSVFAVGVMSALRPKAAIRVVEL